MNSYEEVSYFEKAAVPGFLCGCMLRVEEAGARKEKKKCCKKFKRGKRCGSCPKR